jgi:16S rRNA processing protein RimM
MAFKYIGTITGTSGFDGGLIVKNTPLNIENIKEKSVVRIGFSENFSEEYVLNSCDYFNSDCKIYLEGVSSKEQALTLKENGIFVDEKDIVLTNKNLFLAEDLIGCSVYNNETKNFIGIIKEVMELPANDVWLVKTEAGDLPLPFIDDVVKFVDIKTKRIEIILIEGLNELITGRKAIKNE